MIETLPERFIKKVNLTEFCWLWMASKNNCGYGRFGFDEKVVTAHRFSWIHFNGEIPKDMCVLHKCDNPSCVNPDHLFLGTRKENMDDMRLKGREKDPIGERNGRAKLTREQVEEIRMLYKGRKGNVTLTFLGHKYGVCPWTIRAIINKKLWR